MDTTHETAALPAGRKSGQRSSYCCQYIAVISLFWSAEKVLWSFGKLTLV